MEIRIMSTYEYFTVMNQMSLKFETLDNNY
jgi:hypothetical protein